MDHSYVQDLFLTVASTFCAVTVASTSGPSGPRFFRSMVGQLEFNLRHCLAAKCYVTNPKSDILVIYEVLQIIIIQKDRFRFLINIYCLFYCEITLFITFLVVEKIKPWPIEPTMSGPNFTQYMEPTLTEMRASTFLVNWIPGYSK